jgi:inosine-uridine nucleoside N-ribohydrolase
MAPDDAPRRAVKLIIDTDPGVDDAYAIALAMHTMRDDVKVIGVTTTFGNVRRDDATRNAKTLVNACSTTMPTKE